MPLLAQEHVSIPTKDILSWTFDEPQFDHETPVRLHLESECDMTNGQRYISMLMTRQTVLVHHMPRF